MEQLNIEGKRSGEGFVVHKTVLVNALSQALSERVTLMDFTIGRKGFLTYLKSLGGSNVIKVVPANGSASDLQTAEKRLKVVCGSNTSYLKDLTWASDKPPYTLCDVRVSPSNSVKPNLGTTELAEAIERVLPFTAEEESRPVLQNVLFSVKEGKLSLVSADGYRLAMVTLNYDGEEGQVLIHKDNLKGIATALKHAHRVNLSFSKNGDSKEGMSLVLDTELIRYKWYTSEGTFPDYAKLMPTSFTTLVSFDTTETTKAVSSLKALAEDGSSAIDILITSGKITLSNPDDKGQAEVVAETQGEGKVRLDGGYLAEALRACGGMAELKMMDAKSPVLFTTEGYQLLVMPMFAGGQPVKTESKPVETVATETDKTEAVAEAEAITKTGKSKRKPTKTKEPVAVA